MDAEREGTSSCLWATWVRAESGVGADCELLVPARVHWGRGRFGIFLVDSLLLSCVGVFCCCCCCLLLPLSVERSPLYDFCFCFVLYMPFLGAERGGEGSVVNKVPISVVFTVSLFLGEERASKKKKSKRKNERG